MDTDISAGVVEKSQSLTLTTIPRATTPTLSTSSADMGATITINTPRASSSFTHELAYSFASSGWVTIATAAGTSQSWTIPDRATSLPNATSTTATIRCITKNGSTTIGTKTVTMTVKVPASVVPQVTGVVPTEAVAGLAAQFGMFIRNKSKISVKVTGSGAKGSTIKAYQTTFMGKTYNAASWTSDVLTGSSQAIKARVQDSRGRWSDYLTVNIAAAAYGPPEIRRLQVYRCLEDGTLNNDGTYMKVSVAYSVAPLNNKNTASAVISYKQSTGAEYTEALTKTDLSADTVVGPLSATFSTDYQYDVRLVVTDYFGASSQAFTFLPSGAVILDILADGTGIAFGKTAERSGVDIGWSAKGAVLGMWEATAYVPEGGDLDEYVKPGVYSVQSNAVAATVKNCPSTMGGTLRVFSGLGVNKIAGAWAYLLQEYQPYHPNEPTFRRLLYTDGEGVWTTQEWKPVTLKGQKVLWSGGWTMHGTQKAELSEPVSAQNTGIELVFSRYVNGAGEDNHFQTYRVSKKFVELHPGYGHNILLAWNQFGAVGNKYLYINDGHITGHANNTISGTGASGITFTNGAFVLRYVLGV
jgi:hypothetical protein